MLLAAARGRGILSRFTLRPYERKKILPCDEARAALAREIVPCPLEEHQHLVIKLDQIDNVHKGPCEPGAEAYKAKVRNTGVASDDRQAASVSIAEGRKAFPFESRFDQIASVPPLLHGHRRDRRHGSPPGWEKLARSPITKISGRPGIVRSGSTITRPERSSPSKSQYKRDSGGLREEKTWNHVFPRYSGASTKRIGGS